MQVQRGFLVADDCDTQHVSIHWGLMVILGVCTVLPQIARCKKKYRGTRRTMKQENKSILFTEK
jgi:hypothetical protein